jgi:hypothetical protein
MLLSTNSTAYLVDQGKNLEPILTGVDIRRVQKAGNRNVIVLSDGSVIISENGEDKIQQSGITDRIDSLLVVKTNPLTLLIGCTPPNLYLFIEDEGNAQLVPRFQSLEVRDEWYTPWGGPPAVRSMDKTSDGWIYADIHVGSIMCSPDMGETWRPVNPELHKDVHQVIASPVYRERVYANTYLSVYVSDDRGESWHHRSGALRDRYGRGIAVHPSEPDLLLCGVSDGPSGSNVHGQLYRSEDAGKNWVHIIDGFPDSTKKNIDTYHIQFEGDKAWVADENDLYLSQDTGKTWSLYRSFSEEINVLSTIN